ncbi:MAG: hypothetical protein BGP10_10310 [Rhodanobacter sp. 68-29]|uniref:glycine zipper 2TM domain-containing protein n=1 Tax=Rhodanobacter sp. PCA2 TaxID=2006117 RepID=UPI00086D3434|nr:glycine zipper 2TM domain-containing protein [Rhodanobacter sp. PCA2]MBA2079014.1 hypothetical protein [Rhodanobacter sp. PCA2]MBN8922771.1 glycine zipper 2TM domain-containing protein [Rhodanobacter sp.]ODU75950.1 MAG: hypothetical protein ABT17_00570 [Rhodanobacter sp. SCN 69-32]OJY62165.1 MAG: hypothetical protein BGP10_10310 [Rhodanobacter sp. 68-29]
MYKFFAVALVLALAATGAQAQDARYSNQNPGQDDNAHYGWADVLRVDPVYGVTRTEVPRQECRDQTVVQQRPGNTTAGSILGAVVGGVLGSTVGHGNGRTLSTAVGAVAGGAVGGQVAANRGGSQVEQTVTNCRQVSAVSEQRQIVGYDVEYRYRGEVWEARLSYDPGERLRVRVSVSPAD